MKNQALLFLFLMLFITSCSSIRVASDFDKSTDFRSYTTFQLLEQESSFPVGANPMNQQRLDNGIRDHMINLGFQESANPDLFVTYFVKKVLRQDARIYEDYYEEWEYKQYRDVYEYKEGTLVVDLLDVKQGKVVWHGVLSRPTSENIKTAEKRINQNLDALFDKLAYEIGP